MDTPLPNRLIRIPGITPRHERLFKQAGVHTTESFLEQFATYRFREAFSKQNNVSQRRLLQYVNAADLLRIKGLGPVYIMLMRAIGCFTTHQLSLEEAPRLHAKMYAENLDSKLAQTFPNISTVGTWIKQAKELSKLITHR